MKQQQKAKHIIVNETVHAQLASIKPKGIQYNYLLQFLMVKAGFLTKKDPNLIMSYEFLRKKIEPTLK